MVRIHLIALGQQLRTVHDRHLPVFYVQIPVAVGILEQEDAALGKQRHISSLIYFLIGMVVLIILIYLIDKLLADWFSRRNASSSSSSS